MLLGGCITRPVKPQIKRTPPAVSCEKPSMLDLKKNPGSKIDTEIILQDRGNHTRCYEAIKAWERWYEQGK